MNKEPFDDQTVFNHSITELFAIQIPLYFLILRFGTQWETGYVTCFNKEELGILKDLLKRTPDDILQAGLHPTFDQVLYQLHLGNIQK